MLILAFDTTNEHGGVGIYRDAECLALVPNEGPANQYSISLFEMVGQALAMTHLEISQIELFAAAHGPGSFTGIRVGLAAAQAWSKAFGRPARGVSVLEAMVRKQGLGTAQSELGRCAPDWFFPILDARRGEFFLGVFRRKPSELPNSPRPEYERADPGKVLKPDALREFMEGRFAGGESATCLVRAHDQAAAGLRTVLPSTLNWQSIEGLLVDAVAGIARGDVLSAAPCPDARLEAYYIRRPDAEVKWKGD